MAMVFCGPKSALSVGLKASLKDVMFVESEKQLFILLWAIFYRRREYCPQVSHSLAHHISSCLISQRLKFSIFQDSYIAEVI